MKATVRGFTLLEVMIVVVMLAIGATIWAKFLQNNHEAQQRETAVDAEATDLGLLRRAVSAVVRTPPAAWPPNVVQTINLTTLVADNGLPADFAKRNGVLGTSPLYQRYAVRAIKQTDGKARAVILDTGTVAPSRLDRIGIAPSAQGVQAIKEQVSVRARDKHSIVAGVLPPGATSVAGAGAGFQQDIAAYLADGVAAGAPAAAVILVGFKELEPGGDPFNLGSKWGQCRKKTVQPGGGGWRRPSCDAGFTEIAKWPQCGFVNPNFPHYDVYPTDVGAIILGRDDQIFETQIMTATRDCSPFTDGPSCPYAGAYRVGVFNNYNQKDSYQSVILNGAELEPDPGACETYSPRQGYRQGGLCLEGGADPSAAPNTNGYPCLYQGYSVHPSIADLGINGENILCCEDAE